MTKTEKEQKSANEGKKKIKREETDKHHLSVCVYPICAILNF